MLYNEALIRVVPGKMGEFVDICESEYRPAALKLGKKLAAQWQTVIGPDELINLWVHDDFADLQRFREVETQSEELLKAMRKMWPLTVSNTTKFLVPTPYSPLK